VLKRYQRIKATEIGARAVYCDFETDFIAFTYRHFHGEIRDFLDRMDAERKIKRIAVEELLFDEQWDIPATSLYELSNIKDPLVLAPVGWDDADSRVWKLDRAMSGELYERGKDKSEGAKNIELPYWIRDTVLPLRKELKALMEGHQRGKRRLCGVASITPLAASLCHDSHLKTNPMLLQDIRGICFLATLHVRYRNP
jgi:hypothetical protein